jgi:uncharacterized protein
MMLARALPTSSSSALRAPRRAPAPLRPPRPARPAAAGNAATTTTDEAIIVVRKPTAEEAAMAKTWPTWGCGAETFPWTYGEREQCLVFEGEVVVTPSAGGGPPATIKAGDWAEFPQGLSCTWSVSKPIKKHYNFG